MGILVLGRVDYQQKIENACNGANDTALNVKASDERKLPFDGMLRYPVAD